MNCSSLHATDLPLGWTQMRQSDESSQTKDEDDNCNDPNCRRHSPRPRFTPGSNVLVGDAIFCFGEIEPTWFQGYFVMNHVPYGLLAKQTAVDECLQCADGGYREVELRFYPRGQIKGTVVFEKVQWTGGDMMKLQGDKVEFECEKFYSGENAVPIVKKHFGGLVKKLREHEGNEEDAEILDLMPEVAIVLGRMRLSLPTADSE